MDYQHNVGPLWLISAIIVIIPFWRICKRVGWSPWLSLLWLIPFVGVVFLYILAFSEWPSARGTVVPRGT